MAAQVGKDLIASLIPYRVFKNGEVTYYLGDKDTPPLQVWAQEKLTGLTIFKVDAARISGDPAILVPAGTLRRGARLAFTSNRNEPTLGIYVGMEHSIGDTSFPLRLVRAQFPKLAAPPIGQPCYDAENRLVGIVLGVSRRGTCHLLPAQAISFLADHPKAKRVRLGCLLDINASTPVIEGLISGGPLARGGIQTGDILISINGSPIRNYGDMLDATYYLTGDKPLTVEVIRGTQVVKSKGIIPTQDAR
ncbi:PDZ domain-containing protein [Akkermansia sp.]|uniref:PDZ domain-containing protein n=1 Tax=Akkermansia sp. TaxID=1872421 RepID=UPI0025C1C7C7|nr:PDZ domain-containing protein [Akkermansia sp.]